MGIDLDITKFIHDSDERAFRPIDEKEDREHIETRHQSMSCKEHESKTVRRRDDAQQERTSGYRTSATRTTKPSTAHINQYDAVFLEALNVDSMIQQNGNSRNIAAMSWYETPQAFKRHGKKNGCHVAFAPPVERRIDVCSVMSSRRSRCGCTSTRAYRAGLRWILTRTLQWRYSVLGYSNWGWEGEWLRMNQD